MASTKHQKAQPVRSNEYMPKAGPKKPGFKQRKPSGVRNPNEPTLFDGIHKDRAVKTANRRSNARLHDLTKNFAAHQAALAKKNMIASNNAIRAVATQIIDNFVVAQADSAKGLSRTSVALSKLDDQLEPALLKNKNAMLGGKNAACTALTAAFKDVQDEINELRSKQQLASV